MQQNNAINSAQSIHDNLDRISVPSIPNENTSKKREENNICHTAQIESTVQSAKNVCKSNAVAPVAPMKYCNNAELYDIAKAEYESLRQEYIQLEARTCIEVQKLKNDLKMCESKADIQRQQIKFLSTKVSKLERTEKSMEALIETLKELQE